jgi:hemerythrin-like domain-containing protein
VPSTRIEQWQRGEQDPIEELLTEHGLMDRALEAVAVEAKRLLTRQPVRMQIWGDVIDFFGNYVHLCHRKKEERVLFPALVRAGLASASETELMQEEHRKAELMTLELVDGASEGDWEKIARISELYLHLMRPHLETEERQFFLPLREKVDPKWNEETKKEMQALEKIVLGPYDRTHYLEVVRRLCKDVGVEITF